MNVQRFLARLLVSGLFVSHAFAQSTPAAGATASAPATPPVATAPAATAPAATAPASPAPSTTGPAPALASQSVDPNTYLVGPGDSLQIFVWRNPELTTTVPVRPDGKISTPLVEDMVAVGKTPTQLARDIEKVLAEFIRSPQVNVIVSIPMSAFSKVQVIGQVTNPQSVPYRQGMRVLDAVLASGGLAQYAAGNRARIARKENGKEIVIKVKLNALINDGDMKYNYELKPGDVLVVPESRF